LFFRVRRLISEISEEIIFKRVSLADEFLRLGWYEVGGLAEPILGYLKILAGKDLRMFKRVNYV
jgi:hypothetical protein